MFRTYTTFVARSVERTQYLSGAMCRRRNPMSPLAYWKHSASGSGVRWTRKTYLRMPTRCL
jgi:hypothetical protein